MNEEYADLSGHRYKVKSRYEALKGERSTVEYRSEEYAKWTLPSVFPMDTNGDEELQHDFQSVGARAVNNLSNKIVMTLFSPTSPFFRLDVQPDAEAELIAQGISKANIAQAMSNAEAQATKLLSKRGSRTAFNLAMKHLIITGNCLLYMPEDTEKNLQVYSLRDYVVKRDMSGDMIELITRDNKAFLTLDADVQELVLEKHPELMNNPETDVELFTYVYLDRDKGRFNVVQAVNDCTIDSSSGTYPRKALRWVPLTWELTRGRDYGAGLVEEYAGDFHSLSVLSEALTKGAAVAADIKFLVDPGGSTDINELNRSETGSYIYGRAVDISTPEIRKQQDFNLALQLIQDKSKNIGSAFLLNSAVTRTAERVTAEEIRLQANELETSLGGVYSRLAEELQIPLAFMLMEDIDLKVGDNEIEPLVVTGLESLSRTGQLESMQMFMQDMTMLNGLDPEVRNIFKLRSYALFSASARSVPFDELIKSEQQIQQEQMQMQQQQQMMAAQQATADAAATQTN